MTCSDEISPLSLKLGRNSYTLEPLKGDGRDMVLSGSLGHVFD